MKNLVKNILTTVLIVTAISLTFSNCSKSDDNGVTAADKTTLNAVIDSCLTIINGATATDYPQASITTFQTVLTAAQLLVPDNTVTQTQVDNTVMALQQAKAIFLASAYSAIPASSILLSFNFDDANPTEIPNAGTLSSLKATLMKGPSQIYGANTALPTYVAGVKGGKAIHFTQGSHLEIANYNASSFLTNTMSIAVWVKTDASYPSNYIISLNYWNNWKFQVQDGGKPFFTFATTAGIADADNESDNSVPPGTWTHLAVSLDLTAHTLSFYVNGELSKTWDSTGKPALDGTIAPAYASPTGSQIPLCIGTVTTYAEALAAWTWSGWDTPDPATGWNNMEGAIDNLAVYNIALTAGQVQKLYNDQK